MKTHLNVLAVTSTDGEVDRCGEFVSSVQKDQRLDQWTCNSKFSVDDLVLFYFGQPVGAIVALGLVESEPWHKEGPFDWTNRSGAWVCDFSPMWLLPREVHLKEACSRLGLARWYSHDKPYRSTRELDTPIAEALLHAIFSANPEPKATLAKLAKGHAPDKARGRSPKAPTRPPDGEEFEEGIREITRELRMRNAKLRAAALAEHGTACRACGFDFGAAYGEAGEGYIEVHHLIPSSKGKRTRKSTVKDVDVVCANCHRMLHRNGRVPMAVSDLRAIIEQRKAEKQASK
jgi:5-methylcytosine-specific restriction protein A